MKREEILRKIRELNLPKDSYVVFGSCPLPVASLREANDIDLLVEKELLKKLRQDGWRVMNKGHNDTPLVRDVFEAHDNWNFGSYHPTLQQLLAGATIIEGIPFASLEEVKK